MKRGMIRIVERDARSEEALLKKGSKSEIIHHFRFSGEYMLKCQKKNIHFNYYLSVKEMKYTTTHYFYYLI